MFYKNSRLRTFETCGDNSETVVMTFLVVEVVEAVSVLIDGVVEDVTLVAIPEHQVSKSAENEVHKHKLTRKICLLYTSPSPRDS